MQKFFRSVHQHVLIKTIDAGCVLDCWHILLGLEYVDYSVSILHLSKPKHTFSLPPHSPSFSEMPASLLLDLSNTLMMAMTADACIHLLPSNNWMKYLPVQQEGQQQTDSLVVLMSLSFLFLLSLY